MKDVLKAFGTGFFADAQNDTPCHSERSERSRLPIILLVLFVISLRVIENIFYFKKYGPLSSSAADIWFFIGVAHGDHYLFWLDPLQWLLPFLSNFQTGTLFGLLLILSNGLHLLALTLLVGFLREVYQDERAALWTAAVYACLSTSCIFCTGSFHHQQESLPILIGLIWAACRFSTQFCAFSPRRLVPRSLGEGGFASPAFAEGRPLRENLFRSAAALVLLAILALCVGPDVLVLFAAAIPCGVAWHFRNRGSPMKRLLIGTLVLASLTGVMVHLGPFFAKGVAFLALRLRGIDLAAQRQLSVGDLMPFGWSQFAATYSWLGFGLIALVFWIWIRGRFVEIAFLLTAILFAALAARFYFVVEIGLAILIGYTLTRIFHKFNLMGLAPKSPNALGAIGAVSALWADISQWACEISGLTQKLGARRWLQNIAGVLLVLAFLSAEIWRGFSCLCPGILPSLLAKVQQDTQPDKLVFCSPTYGFLVRGASGAKPTSDMHHLDTSWVKLAAQPAADAIMALRKRGGTHLFLTSHDFQIRETRSSDGSLAMQAYGSGGFEHCLSELSQEEMRRSLVVRAFTEKFQNFPHQGMKFLGARHDPATQLTAVLYRLE